MVIELQMSNVHIEIIVITINRAIFQGNMSELSIKISIILNLYKGTVNYNQYTFFIWMTSKCVRQTKFT